MIVTRYFDTIAEAGAFQDTLMDEYDSVQVMRTPFFCESGIYQWEVK